MGGVLDSTLRRSVWLHVGDGGWLRIKSTNIINGENEYALAA